MIRGLFCGAAGVVLVACQPQIPESGVVVSQQVAPAPAQVQPQTQASLPPAGEPLTAIAPASQTAAATPPAAQPLPSSVTAAVAAPDPAERIASTQAASANSGVAPIEASPSNAAPVLVNNPGISSEQDFSTVSSQRTIQSDAQRIAANRAQYQVIAPTALPTRSGNSQPNIVQYALSTKHPVGTQLHRRNSFRSAQRVAAACSAFPSADQAQIAFLARGGPQRDRKGLDPDGDGYACTWDPSPFRTVNAQPAPAPAVQEQSALARPVETAQTAAPVVVNTAPAEAVSQDRTNLQQLPPGIAPPLVISSE